MKDVFIFLVFVSIVFSTAYADKLEKYILDSKSGDILYSQPTVKGQVYRITVEGKYRQWQQSSSGFGVDAVWYNDIPAFGNEMLDDYIAEMLKLPIWLGDSSVYSIPSFPPFIEGMKFGLRQFTGFRINGEPLDMIPVDTVLHRYQIERIGDGGPFWFQILDSVFSLSNEKTEPRYDDNNGTLMITIEELTDTTANICGMEVNKLNETTIQIKVRASLLVKDSSSTQGEKNILYDLSQIGIVENNMFICPDSIVCNEESKLPAAIGLIIDRSASMDEPISQKDLFTSRLDAMKQSVVSFIEQLQTESNPKDSAFILSFSNRTILEKDFTDNKDSLKEAVNKIKSDSATAFYSALIEGLEKVSKHPNPRKAVIALTDGDNTRGPVWSNECLDLIATKYKNIQIYLIGLSFSDSEREKLALDTMHQIVSKVRKGNVFQINQKDSLQQIYDRIGTDLTNDDCCSIYFHSQGCDTPGEERKVKILFISGDDIIIKEIKYKCKADTVVSSVYWDKNEATGFDIKPNPSKDYSLIEFNTTQSEFVTIVISDLLGKTVLNFEKFFERGNHQFVVDTGNILAGSYIINIQSKSMSMMQKLIVIH